jgi:hypothetical protein
MGVVSTTRKTRYPWYRRLGGPQGRYGRVRKNSPLPGFDPRTVQPVASRYTDWAIPGRSETNGINEEKDKIYCDLWCVVKRSVRSVPLFRRTPLFPSSGHNCSYTLWCRQQVTRKRPYTCTRHKVSVTIRQNFELTDMVVSHLTKR